MAALPGVNFTASTPSGKSFTAWMEILSNSIVPVAPPNYAPAYLKTSIRLYAGQTYRLKFDYNVSGTIFVTNFVTTTGKHKSKHSNNNQAN